MAKNLITALRQLPQLRGSTFLAAVEIAHRCDDRSGIGYISYSYLADKIHQSRRTAFRQVKRLEALGVLAVQRFYRPKGQAWGINQYRFIVPWQRPHAYPPAQEGSGVIKAAKLPQEENTSKKYGTLAEVGKAKHRALGWLTPGSQLYQMTQAIAVPS